MIDERLMYNVLKSLYMDGYDCFASEAQLRDAFAIKLGSTYPNCIIIPEYTQQKPKGWGCSEELIHFDLLIHDKNNNEQVLIEFKYKKKPGCFVTKNGMFLDLREHNDSTNGRYAIWRDIYRIEAFTNINKIDKGFIIFITNNGTFFANPRKGSLAEQYSIAPGLHKQGDLMWNTSDVKSSKSIQACYKKDSQPLTIQNDYFFLYPDYSSITDIEGKKHFFKQLVLPIYSKSYTEKIETELRRLGKETFVEYYNDFKTQDKKNVKKAMLKKTENPRSINTCSSTGIGIFKTANEIQYLRNVISSVKVPITTREKAEKILKKELGI